MDLGKSIQLHPPYSPDFAPSDFYVFHCLQNVLNDKEFSLEEKEKIFVENFLSSKPAKSFFFGINNQANK